MNYSTNFNIIIVPTTVIPGIYRISRSIDSDFNLAIWQTRQDHQINLCHYQSIYTTSMGFSSHRTEICQFKITPTAFSEQTAKYNVRQYFCLYGI